MRPILWRLWRRSPHDRLSDQKQGACFAVHRLLVNGLNCQRSQPNYRTHWKEKWRLLEKFQTSDVGEVTPMYVSFVSFYWQYLQNIAEKLITMENLLHKYVTIVMRDSVLDLWNQRKLGESREVNSPFNFKRKAFGKDVRWHSNRFRLGATDRRLHRTGRETSEILRTSFIQFL